MIALSYLLIYLLLFIEGIMIGGLDLANSHYFAPTFDDNVECAHYAHGRLL